MSAVPRSVLSELADVVERGHDEARSAVRQAEAQLAADSALAPEFAQQIAHAVAPQLSLVSEPNPHREFDAALEAVVSGSAPGLVTCADNLDVLAHLVAIGRTVDLIYIDPPYASGANYASSVPGPDGAASSTSYRDIWSGGLVGYLDMLVPRLVLMRAVLAAGGSAYVHLDWHASHYVKVVLDEVFGVDCFINDIAWLYGLGGSSKRYWPRKHDSLLWYAREPGQHWFEADMIPATSARMRGQLKKAPDYWDIPTLNNQAHERTGYATQKPLALLERVVRSSCPPGGLVADFFAGSGTTAVAAERLARRWLAVDADEVAVATAAARLETSATLWR